MGRKFAAPSKGNKNTRLIDIPADNETLHIDLVKFSFKYLILDNETFSYTGKTSEYFVSFIQRLRHICGMKCQELKYPTVQALRNHYINWEDTNHKSFGLPNEDQLIDRPFQFGITGNEHGRIIGFFIGSTFYIVWFDPDHNTYS